MHQTELREHIVAAALQGDLQLLVRIVEAVGPLTARLDDDPDELTTLHMACSAGHCGLVEYLLSSAVGSDPCAARRNAFTPLHAAAMNGHTEVCRQLIGHGAYANAQTDPQGYSPLHSAAFGGHVDTVSLLLASGADPRLRNYRNETPAEAARRAGQVEVARRLEGCGDP